MIKKLLILLFVFHSSYLFAQTIKTDVLVIGGSPSGVAAAIQSARSKVKTVLVAENFYVSITTKAGNKLSVTRRINTSSGVWAEFQNGVMKFYKDSAAQDKSSRFPLVFEKTDGEMFLKKMTDSVKNLKVYFGAGLESLEKNGDGWEASVTQNAKKITIKARIIIDATDDGIAVKKAGAKFNGTIDVYKEELPTSMYRTSIAAGSGGAENQHQPKTFLYLPLNNALANGVDNMLVTEKTLPDTKIADYLPLQLQIGQGAGATAAYCAFFKTTTKHLKVRVIQGELLDFKADLVPFDDVMQTDPDWRAIQQVCATGLLKGCDKIGRFIFDADASVTTAEIKPVLTEIYTRAFLWFNKEKPGEKFTIENTLSLISDYTLTDPIVLKGSIQRDWKTRYKFNQDFDLKRQITRREFAVLANRYLNPFARTVDLDGRFVN